MQLEVEFEPRTVGSHSKRLFVHYDTGMRYSLLRVLHVKKGQMGNRVKQKRKWLFWLHLSKLRSTRQRTKEWMSPTKVMFSQI